MASYFDENLETIEKPNAVYKGEKGEFIAVRKIKETNDKFVVVIYREIDNKDGFVITSFITNKSIYFERKKLIWKP